LILKLGLIGAGQISPYHIVAAQKAGFRIEWICARPNSLNALTIASKFRIPRVLNSVEEIGNQNFDALSIVASTHSQVSLLQKCLSFGKPILIEKPVSTNSKELKKIMKMKQISKVIINLNRRHYQSVQKLKQLIDKNMGDLSFVVNIPELTWDLRPDKNYAHSFFVDNSVHVLDLIHYLFGYITDMHLINCNRNKLSNVAAVCKTKSGAIGTINVSFSSTANISIRVFTKKFSYLLKPLEVLTVYAGMETKYPDSQHLYKRYTPIIHKKIEPKNTKEVGKLGFMGQYLDLKNLIFQHENANLISANIVDAFNAVKVANLLIK
jgi:predicted dehydrogenase